MEENETTRLNSHTVGAEVPDAWRDAMVSERSRRHDRERRRDGRAAAVLGSAAALAGLAVAMNWQARQAEHRYPPVGKFVTVKGVRLHYIEAGEGPAVVLLHGNASLLQDPGLSIFRPLAQTHRVIAFDRPGFGYSERPKSVVWTPEAQANLFHEALLTLGVDRAVIYGHSWSTTVAMTLALAYPDLVSGVVLASGYYYPQRRPDAAISSLNVAPVIGPILRNTLSPLMGLILGKAMVRASFSPNPIPATYSQFPARLIVRPSTIRASAEEAKTMRPWAVRASPHYRQVQVPVTILTGADDRLVNYRKQSLRLHREIPNSTLRVWPRTGHMVHHVHPGDVIDAIDETWRRAEEYNLGTQRPGDLV